jgi:hypothetical protein
VNLKGKIEFLHLVLYYSFLHVPPLDLSALSLSSRLQSAQFFRLGISLWSWSSLRSGINPVCRQIGKGSAISWFYFPAIHFPVERLIPRKNHMPFSISRPQGFHQLFLFSRIVFGLPLEITCHFHSVARVNL